MARPPGAQITRDRPKDGSITFGLRVRIQGADERVPLGNTGDGWDEIRAEQARKQLLAKIELGQWTPRTEATVRSDEEEPSFRELATEWLEARKRNPAIRPRTTELNESQLKRYLAPSFGELRPSQITIAKIKQYREQIHRENEQIREAAQMGRPLRDSRTALKLRTLSNESINKTLRTLALILDAAEDAGWIERNLARGRRMREPLERRHDHGTLDVDELLDLLEAAGELDSSRRRPETLQRAAQVRALRDEAGLAWPELLPTRHRAGHRLPSVRDATGRDHCRGAARDHRHAGARRPASHRAVHAGPPSRRSPQGADICGRFEDRSRRSDSRRPSAVAR